MINLFEIYLNRILKCKKRDFKFTTIDKNYVVLIISFFLSCSNINNRLQMQESPAIQDRPSIDRNKKFKKNDKDSHTFASNNLILKKQEDRLTVPENSESESFEEYNDSQDFIFKPSPLNFIDDKLRLASINSKQSVDDSDNNDNGDKILLTTIPKNENLEQTKRNNQNHKPRSKSLTRLKHTTDSSIKDIQDFQISPRPPRYLSQSSICSVGSVGSAIVENFSLQNDAGMVYMSDEESETGNSVYYTELSPNSTTQNLPFIEDTQSFLTAWNDFVDDDNKEEQKIHSRNSTIIHNSSSSSSEKSDFSLSKNKYNNEHNKHNKHVSFKQTFENTKVNEIKSRISKLEKQVQYLYDSRKENITEQGITKLRRKSMAEGSCDIKLSSSSHDTTMLSENDSFNISEDNTLGQSDNIKHILLETQRKNTELKFKNNKLSHKSLKAKKKVKCLKKEIEALKTKNKNHTKKNGNLVKMLNDLNIKNKNLKKEIKSYNKRHESSEKISNASNNSSIKPSIQWHHQNDDKRSTKMLSSLSKYVWYNQITRKEKFNNTKQTINNISINKNSNLLISCHEDQVDIWDISRRQLKENGPVIFSEDKIYALEFHPLQANIFSTIDAANNVQVWDLEKKTNISKNGYPDRLLNLSYNSTGNIIAINTFNDTKLNLWDPNSNKSIRTLEIPKSTFTTKIGFCKDKLIAGSDDIFYVWDMKTYKLYWQKSVNNLFELSTNKFFPCAVATKFNSSEIEIFDVYKKEKINFTKCKMDFIQHIELSHDANTFGIIGKGSLIELYNTKKTLSPLERRINAKGSALCSISFGPNGYYFATGDKNGTVKVWTTLK